MHSFRLIDTISIEHDTNIACVNRNICQKCNSVLSNNCTMKIGNLFCYYGALLEPWFYQQQCNFHLIPKHLLIRRTHTFALLNQKYSKSKQTKQWTREQYYQMEWYKNCCRSPFSNSSSVHKNGFHAFCYLQHGARAMRTQPEPAITIFGDHSAVCLSYFSHIKWFFFLTKFVQNRLIYNCAAARVRRLIEALEPVNTTAMLLHNKYRTNQIRTNRQETSFTSEKHGKHWDLAARHTHTFSGHLKSIAFFCCANFFFGPPETGSITEQ